MGKISINQAKVGDIIAEDVCLRNSSTLLAGKGTILNEKWLQKLSDKGIEAITIEDGGEQSAPESLPVEENDTDELPEEATELAEMLEAESVKMLDQTIEQTPEKDLKVVPTEDAFEKHIRSFHEADRSREHKEKVLSQHSSAVEQAHEVFGHVQKGGSVDTTPITKTVESLLGSFAQNTGMFSRLAHFHDSSKGHIVQQSINTTINALIIGKALKYDHATLSQLGIVGFLYDLGMSRVPDRILFKAGPLTPDEWWEVRKHPIHSFDICSKALGVPHCAPLAAYQHHEQPNGNGYPKGRKKHLIHEFAKILTVAMTYAALSAPRPYRSSLSPHKAMEALIRLAGEEQIDREVMRAFLSELSYYPVGSWVSLSDGSRACVVNAHPHKYTHPAVRVVFDAEENFLEDGPVIKLASTEDISIVGEIAEPNFNGELTSASQTFAGF